MSLNVCKYRLIPFKLYIFLILQTTDRELDLILIVMRNEIIIHIISKVNIKICLITVMLIILL